MISTVSRPDPRLTQLITTRKVGRPDKERAGSSTTVTKKKQKNPEDDKVEENLVFYTPSPGGMSFNRYTPTGQYIDTYA